MSYRLTIKAALLIAISFAIAVVSAAQDGSGVPKKQDVASANEATLSGTIVLTGKRPWPLKIDMSADPVCLKMNPNPTSQFVVGSEGRLANVLVYVKSKELAQRTFEQPASPALLDHKACNYAPRVMGMRTGQTLAIFNRDATVHNTHAVSRSNPDWNQTQMNGTPPLTHVFQKSEVVAFKCNQHPWEKAYVAVFDHPFFAVSDQSGNFKIEGVPPGQYTVVAWHESFGEQTMEVTVVSGEAKDVGFTFAAK
jgi:plastocyanin